MRVLFVTRASKTRLFHLRWNVEEVVVIDECFPLVLELFLVVDLLVLVFFLEYFAFLNS